MSFRGVSGRGEQSRTLLWRLRGLVEDVDCIAWSSGDGGVALAVQRAGEFLLYENHHDLNAAIARATELRALLMQLGLVDASAIARRAPRLRQS